MPNIDGGFLNCWRQTARKLGFIQEWKKPCKNGMFCWKMKKEDEKRKMEELHQQSVNEMINSAEGSAGLLHKFTKPTAWRGRSKDLEERRRGCQAVGPLLKQRGKSGQALAV